MLARQSLPGARGSVHSLLAYGGESSPLCSQASPQQQLLSRSRRPPLRHTLSECTTEDGYCANGMEKRPFLSSERVLKTCIPRFVCLFVCLLLGRPSPPFKPPFGSRHPSSLKRRLTLEQDGRAKPTISHHLVEAAFSDTILPSIRAPRKKFTRGTVQPKEWLLHSRPGLRWS